MLIKNVFRFKYLGIIFMADAKQINDINTRIAKAFTRYGELRNVFDARAAEGHPLLVGSREVPYDVVPRLPDNMLFVWALHEGFLPTT